MRCQIGTSSEESAGHGGRRYEPYVFAGEMDGKLWFCTNNTKDVYKDMQENPEIEISVSSPSYAWIRLHGTAVFENNMSAKEMCIANPIVKGQYQPSELVPRCPKCGEPMSMIFRADNTFVEDEGWHNAAERYAEFLRRHDGMRSLYLELGIGANTPVIIKYSFWRMTAENPQATYVCVNLGEAYAPENIRKRSICIDGDIGEILHKL